MKKITMTKSLCGSNGWHEDGTQDFIRVSRWITVKTNYNPTPKNSLWDYAEDGYGYKPSSDKFNPDEHGGLYLTYFTYKGRNYATEQFLALGNPFYNPVTYSYEDEDGKIYYLSGVDGDNYYNPIFVEFDECCERVRIYEEA